MTTIIITHLCTGRGRDRQQSSSPLPLNFLLIVCISFLCLVASSFSSVLSPLHISVSASLGDFARRPVGLRARDGHIVPFRLGVVPYEPVHDEIILALHNETSGYYFNGANGYILNSDGSQSSPTTGEVVIARPPPGLEPTIVLPNEHALVVTVDPHTGNLVAPSGLFVNVDDRTEIDSYGNVVREIPADKHICIVTTNGTLVDVTRKHQQLNPETLTIVADSTDAVQPIYTPPALQPIQYVNATWLDESTPPSRIVIVAYNSTLDTYMDVSTGNVVNSDGSESDIHDHPVSEGGTHITVIPANPRSIVCTVDDAGNLITTAGEYVDLAHSQLISRDSQVRSIPSDKIIVVATDAGSVIEVVRKKEGQLDPESLIPITKDLSSVRYTRTPEYLNTIMPNGQEDKSELGSVLASHGIDRHRREDLTRRPNSTSFSTSPSSSSAADTQALYSRKGRHVDHMASPASTLTAAERLTLAMKKLPVLLPQPASTSELSVGRATDYEASIKRARARGEMKEMKKEKRRKKKKQKGTNSKSGVTGESMILVDAAAPLPEIETASSPYPSATVLFIVFLLLFAVVVYRYRRYGYSKPEMVEYQLIR